MHIKGSKSFIISALIVFFLSGAACFSHATLSMDEVRFLFEKEVGKPWGDATADEQKAFIDDVRGREEYQEGKFKDLLQERDEGAEGGEGTGADDEREMTVPFEIRASYEAKTGIAWEEAPEDEREAYKKQYYMEVKKQKVEQKLYDQEKTADERTRRRELRLQEQKLRLESKLRAQEEKLRRQELNNKRREARRALKEQKKKWDSFRQKLQEKHQKK